MLPGGRSDRIEYLDALRGIAVFLVILFHAYARWPEVVPYGDQFSSFPVFHYGWLGVQLFFMISGFVIFLTLDKCSSFLEFGTRRWLRLFPAMLFCSLFIFVTAPLVPERPAGTPEAVQLIPGLIFFAWTSPIGILTTPIEGSFWTLFIEAKFYVVAGLSYFLTGSRRATLAILVILFLTAVLGEVAQRYGGILADSQLLRLLYILPTLLNAQYYGWFAVGAFLYVYLTQRSPTALALAAVVAILEAVQQADLMSGAHSFRVTFLTMLVAIAFFAPVLSGTVRRLLNQPTLLFLGYISYPLYLVHENLMVALIVKIGRWLPWMPPIVIPLLPICGVVLIAWLVTKYAEPPIRRFLERLLVSLLPLRPAR